MTIKPIRKFKDNLEIKMANFPAVQKLERKPCCSNPIKGRYITSLVLHGQIYDCYKCDSCGMNGVFVLVTKPKSLTGDGEYWDG